MNAVAITPDGKRVLSGGNDHCIRDWDAGIGKLNGQWKGSGHFVLSIATLPDAKRAISTGAGSETSLKMWGLESYELMGVLKGHSTYVESVAVSRDGSCAVSGSSDTTVRFWDLTTAECLATLKGHSKKVNSVQITPDGRFAVSGSYDETVRVWDLETHVCVGTLEGHQSDVYSVAISPDGALIASVAFQDREHALRIWDLASGACLQNIETKWPDTFTSVTFSPDGLRIFAGIGSGEMTNTSIYVYRLTGVRPALATAPTRRYVNAKVVLIGEGTVGKTSLAHRLIEDRYVVRDRTHGMNVWRLDLPEVGQASSLPSSER